MGHGDTQATGTKALPLDEITLLFYMPKEGTNFTEANTLIRYVENRGCGISICTDPIGLVETDFTPITADVASEDVDSDPYAGLVVCPAQDGSLFESISHNVTSLLKQFHAADKFIICLGNACSQLFAADLIDMEQAETVSEGNYRYGKVFFTKDGDTDGIAETLAEQLQRVRQQRTLQ